MFFTIKSSTPKQDVAKYKTRRTANTVLLCYPFGVSELLLNRYLSENYNMSLRTACKKLITCAKVSLNFKNEIIITFPDPVLNNIAKIITFGTGRVPGSNILRTIFTLKRS